MNEDNDTYLLEEEEVLEGEGGHTVPLEGLFETGRTQHLEDVALTSHSLLHLAAALAVGSGVSRAQ